MGFTGSVAGTLTGTILAGTGAALSIAPEPTGISKVAAVTTTSLGVATISDAAPGVYSNAVNFVRATQGSLVYLPESGSSMLANRLAPGSQTAQDLAQISSLSLALASGRAYVGVAPLYSGSAFSQYGPVGINGMLDYRAAMPTGPFKNALILNPNYGASTASRILDKTQILQSGTSIYDSAQRINTYLQGTDTK